MEKVSNLNVGCITQPDYKHAENASIIFNIKKLRRSSWPFFNSDTLLLAYILENFSDTIFKRNNLDPAGFLSQPVSDCSIKND